ncbi:hypothetical protein M5D96_009175, partial [Drosophila gunungcola]
MNKSHVPLYRSRISFLKKRKRSYRTDVCVTGFDPLSCPASDIRCIYSSLIKLNLKLATESIKNFRSSLAEITMFYPAPTLF